MTGVRAVARKTPTLDDTGGCPGGDFARFVPARFLRRTTTTTAATTNNTSKQTAPMMMPTKAPVDSVEFATESIEITSRLESPDDNFLQRP